MELWIRSQDKTKLVKIDNISYLDMSDDYEKEVHSLFNDCKGILGVYKTKNRALEVLDEIQDKINLINLGHDFGSPMIDLKNPTYIYQMPED